MNCYCSPERMTDLYISWEELLVLRKRRLAIFLRSMGIFLWQVFMTDILMTLKKKE